MASHDDLLGFHALDSLKGGVASCIMGYVIAFSKFFYYDPSDFSFIAIFESGYERDSESIKAAFQLTISYISIINVIIFIIYFVFYTLFFTYFNTQAMAFCDFRADLTQLELENEKFQKQMRYFRASILLLWTLFAMIICFFIPYTYFKIYSI